MPSQVKGKFAVFCPGNVSCFVNLALFMRLLCRDLPLLRVNVSNL